MDTPESSRIEVADQHHGAPDLDTVHPLGTTAAHGTPGSPFGCGMRMTCGPSLVVGSARFASDAPIWHAATPVVETAVPPVDLSKDPPPPRLPG